MLSEWRGHHAARVQRAVDRVDDHRGRRTSLAERDLAALLGDRGELVALARAARSSSAKTMSSAAAVDRQRAVAALADPRRTRSARRSRGSASKSSRWAATIRRQAPSHRRREHSRRRAASRLESSACAPSGHARDPLSPRSAIDGRRRLRGSLALGDGGERPDRRIRRPTPSGASPTHGEGPLLVLGAAGSGRTRGARPAPGEPRRRGTPPGAASSCWPARGRRAQRLRARADALIDRPYEELWISTYEERRRAAAARVRARGGTRPVLRHRRAADRLAILLDRIDDLPLRRHEIRGNPAGLLARLLRRDRRAEGRGGRARAPARLGASAASARRPSAAERERAAREREFAELYARHDRILREAGSLDARRPRARARPPARRARRRPRRAVAERFPFVLVDELEDAGAAHRALLDGARAAHGNLVCACDPPRRSAVRGAACGRGRPLTSHPRRRARRPRPPPLRRQRSTDAAGRRSWRPTATARSRGGRRREIPVRFWRCSNDRAQAQAVAREVEHLLAAGEVRPRRVCVIAGSGWREGAPGRGGARGAQRPLPLRRRRGALPAPRGPRRRSPGCGCSPTRPTRRPSSGRSPGRRSSSARSTSRAAPRSPGAASSTWSRRSRPRSRAPAPPEARDRIQAFLKLHRAASRALEQIRADVFVRRRPRPGSGSARRRTACRAGRGG